MNRRQDNREMSVIVHTVCGWLKGFILLYGIYIILYGSKTPGGGFAGGVIAASAFMLIVLAEGEHAAERTFSRRRASTFATLGTLLFWLMAMLGILIAGVFFGNFWDRFIDVCEIGIGLLVCSSLYLILTALQTLPSATGAEKEGDAT